MDLEIQHRPQNKTFGHRTDLSLSDSSWMQNVRGPWLVLKTQGGRSALCLFPVPETLTWDCIRYSQARHSVQGVGATNDLSAIESQQYSKLQHSELQLHVMWSEFYSPLCGAIELDSDDARLRLSFGQSKHHDAHRRLQYMEVWLMDDLINVARKTWLYLRPVYL